MANRIKPGNKFRGLVNDLKFPDKIYIKIIEITGIKPNNPPVKTAKQLKRYEQINIFSISFLSKMVEYPNSIEIIEKTRNRISFVANLEYTRIKRLLENSRDIINPYILDKSFFTRKYKENTPNTIANSVGIRTIS